VLFADIVGFTGLAESADPEQVKNLLDRCFARLARDVTAYGGRVDKIVGDAMVALFGAPTAHEDDAERAVRAALQMQRSLAEELGPERPSLRIGVNTGEVLVGAPRAGGDATVLGDVVNVASRLQTAAAPGQVIVGPATWAATSEIIHYQALGPLQARGRGEPVDIWMALDVLAPPGHRPPRPNTPLVGRDDELGLLCGALDTMVRRRRTQLVLLLGEAGIGKSRLAEELACDARRRHGALVVEGRCVPYGEANLWWPVAEALREACGIEASDSADDTEAKVLASVAAATRLGSDAAEAQRLAAGILFLMGDEEALADVDPTRARDEARRAVFTFMEALAQSQPLVLVLSELHWADDLVLSGIDQLLERLRGVPFMLIATARPDLESRWTPAPGRHNCVVLTLDPLDEGAALQLLTSLFESEPPGELRELLLERSGGNPFFLEELAALLGRGTPSTDRLPATLRGLVSARLDALNPTTRAVLEDASVIGRTAPVDTLEALARARGEKHPDRAVRDLAAGDLLVLDTDDWAFRSDLVREVAYETLTKAERARRHSTFADLLSARARQLGREDEELEQLAHHYGTAAHLVGELGAVEGVPDDLGRQALDTVIRAAVRAEERDLHEAAARLLDQGAELATQWGQPADRRKVLLSRASVRATLYRLTEARVDLTEARASAQADNDAWAQARALTVLGYVLHKEGSFNEAVSTLDDAVKVWRDIGDRLGEAEALRLTGMAYLMADDADSAEAPISEALAISQELHAGRGEAWALQNLAWIAFQRGQLALAENRLNESLVAFADANDYGGMSWALGLLGWLRFFEGRRDEAEAIAQQILGELEDSGDRWGRAMMAVLLANIRLWKGGTREAVARARAAAADFKELADTLGQFRTISPMVRGLIALGQVEEGLACLDEARELAARLAHTQTPWLGPVMALSIGVQLGDTHRIAAVIDEGRAWADREDSASEVYAQVALGELQLGRADPAVSRLQHVVRSPKEDLISRFIASSLALAYAAAGRPADAIAAANRTDDEPVGTYLDEATALAARGFAEEQLGHRDEAETCFGAATDVVDATEDLLAQAVMRLAPAIAFGDSHGMAEARDRLAVLGVTAEGWITAFTLAARPGQALG
jgi:class 3 adenylate cyclase/tetratricopeptide (TPR) repeat protein